jgi:hypothetical protein
MNIYKLVNVKINITKSMQLSLLSNYFLKCKLFVIFRIFYLIFWKGSYEKSIKYKKETEI